MLVIFVIFVGFHQDSQRGWSGGLWNAMIDQSMMVALWLSQYNAIQCNTLEYNTFYYNNIVMIDQSMMVALWLSQCNAIKCNTLECNTFYYNCIALIDQSMMVSQWLSQYHTMQYNPNIIQCSRTESRVSLKIKKRYSF